MHLTWLSKFCVFSAPVLTVLQVLQWRQNNAFCEFENSKSISEQPGFLSAESLSVG